MMEEDDRKLSVSDNNSNVINQEDFPQFDQLHELAKLMSIILKQKQQIEEMQLKLVLGTGCQPESLEVDRAELPTVATVVSSNKSKDHGYYLAMKYKVILADNDLAEIMLMHGEFYLVVFLLTRRNIT